MFRVVNNLKLLNLYNNNSIINKQPVRWRIRKPLSLGTARSKLFRIPVKPIIDADEAAEIKRLFNIYRTQVKSLRKYFIHKHSIDLTASVDSEQHRKEDEEDFKRCSQLNDKWNEAQQIQRETRFAKELELNLTFAGKRKIEKIQEAENKFIESEKLVRAEIEASKTFVTGDNLDAAIEHAINNPVDYNYAIDLDGNKIIGRETTPKPAEITEKRAVKQ